MPLLQYSKLLLHVFQILCSPTPEDIGSQKTPILLGLVRALLRLNMQQLIMLVGEMQLTNSNRVLVK